MPGYMAGDKWQWRERRASINTTAEKGKARGQQGSRVAEGVRANGSRASGGYGRMIDGQGKSILQVTYPGSFGTKGFGRRPPSGCTVGGREE